MAWRDDIQEVKYTSPGGKEFIFFYENLSVEVERKTAEFIFPERDGCFIQDMGIAGRKFPFTCYFSGESYNKDADDFLKALEEKGIAELVHPLYGTRKVVPTGSITRRDDLISESNQAAFSVTFSETIDLKFPETEQNAESEISTSLDDSSTAVSTEYADNVKFENAGDNISLTTQMDQQSFSINDMLKTGTSTMDSISSTYQQYMTTYTNMIDSVVDDAAAVATQLINIVRLPSRTAQDIKLKLNTYSDLITHLKSDFLNAVEGIPNAFHETNKNVMACLIGSNESVLYHTFHTRNEAIETSELLLKQFDDLKEFQDKYIVDLNIVDTGSGFASLSKVISKVVGYLVSNSFSLPSEKKIILGNGKDVFSIVNEVYGNLELLDEFIINNNLTADEIENLPAGREVKYYK